MDEQASTFYEQRFEAQYLRSKGAAFQTLFASIMSKAHPADFIPCRPWGKVGDRKNDGYLKSERTLFQVYAPNEMRVADTIKKIETDFNEALPYWQTYFDVWVFVHNAHEGLPPDVIANLLELEDLHAAITVTHWGFDELLLRFKKLSSEALRSLYGSPPPSDDEKTKSAARAKLNLSQDLVRSGKQSEAIDEMQEALALARAAGNEEEEAEILVALAIISSDRRGRSDRQHYFKLAEQKADKLKSNASKAIYFRARAGALEERGDIAAAEKAYQEALRCCAEPDDEKGNLAIQGCIARASYVHFLCSEKRLDDAQPILAACEKHARANKDAEDGELFLEALRAGIHFSLDSGDEDGALSRITELEQFATTSRLADRMGGDLVNVANQASHRKVYKVALAAAAASVRLGRKAADLSPRFLAGALYTEAMVIAQAGDNETALGKAEAILDLCNAPEDAAIKQAAQHLIAEIRRVSGDSQTAVDMATEALRAAKGTPEQIALTKCAVARALSDNGQTEEALKHVKEAWTLVQSADIPPEGAIEILFQMSDYASQLGANEDVAAALTALQDLPDKSESIKADKGRAIARSDANRQLRDRLLYVLQERDPAKVAGVGKCKSLPEANASVARPLLSLWDDMRDARLESVAGAYDFWGRGNFERVLLNTRQFPNSFNVTLEVRSLDDVKRALRIWGLYADFLLLLWKGATDNGLALIPFPEDYEHPGGWGYMIAAADVLESEGSPKIWHPAMGYISIFPEEVAAFLATEARPFIESGRLVVVPAVGAGCVNPGHGPFEQLLAEAANAIPSVRWKGVEGTLMGYVPHSPDAPFELLAELADVESVRLRKLRLLLLQRSRQLRPERADNLEAKTLALEIDDALRDLEDRNNAFARKNGLEKAKEPLVGATMRFKSSGRKLADVRTDSPYAPLLVLQSLGYGWRVDGPEIPRFPARFEPQEGDVIGAWLAPPSAGWGIPTARR